jgi:hypothetical protein
MKRIPLALLFAATLLISSSVAQTSDSNDQQKLLALVKEVQTQQTQIASNQTKIDTKLVDLAETIRVARVHAGKIGK